MMFRINNCTAFRLCCEGKMFFGGTYGVVLLELDVYLALGSCGLLGGCCCRAGGIVPCSERVFVGGLLLVGG
jgi:hypothetical protein